MSNYLFSSKQKQFNQSELHTASCRSDFRGLRRQKLKLQEVMKVCDVQVPGETEGEAAPAGKKTAETVKAVSSLLPSSLLL